MMLSADEAFMTGTPFCMLPVTSLNDVKIGDGKVGSDFKKLLEQWSSNMNLDIAKQIKEWNHIDGEQISDHPLINLNLNNENWLHARPSFN